MFRIIGFSVIVLCVLTTAAHAEDENVYRKARVGDWTLSVGKMMMGDTSVETESKTVVVKKKTDVDVTYELKTKRNGVELPSETVVIKFDQEYDPFMLKEGPDRKIKVLGKGEETLTIGGKTVVAKWVESEITIKAADKNKNDMTTKHKIWIANTVPLGMVKLEDEMFGQGKLTSTVKDFGFV